MITTASYKQHKKAPINYKELIVANKAVVNFDPTKTTGLRNAFVRQMDIRFNNLKYAISKAIIDQDCFGLIQSTGKLSINVARRADAPDSLPGPKAFAFSRDPEKMDSFMTWLKAQEKAGILKTTKINQLGTAAEEAWTNTYIQDSYKRGVQRATYEIGKAGVQLPNQIPGGLQAVINTPFHLDRVGLLYTRSFGDLIGVSTAMDTKISQILAQGLVDGDNPRVLAKKINDQVDGIGKTRARTLARTEIIRAHHSGMVGEYKNYGIAGVKVKAEWVTAGFNVCSKCQSLEGKIYTLAEIEGMIPFHPNCRCMALPVVDDSKVKEVEKVVESNTLEDIINKSDFTYYDYNQVKKIVKVDPSFQDKVWSDDIDELIRTKFSSNYPIIIDEDGVILDGNHRYVILKERKRTDEMVFTQMNSSDLNKLRAKAIESNTLSKFENDSEYFYKQVYPKFNKNLIIPKKPVKKIIEQEVVEYNEDFFKGKYDGMVRTWYDRKNNPELSEAAKKELIRRGSSLEWPE